MLLLEDFMTTYIMSASSVNSEKHGKRVDIQMSDSDGGHGSDCVIILKDKPTQKDKGKGKMIEDTSVPKETDGEKNCEDTDIVIGSLSRSRYKRKTMSKPKVSKAAGISQAKEKIPISKKLFLSPTTTKKSPTTSKRKSPQQNIQVDFDISHVSPVVHTSQSLNRITPNKGQKHFIPKKFKSHFIPTPAMGLNEVEHEIALYIYGRKYDESELVFKCGDVTKKRADLFALCPGNTIPNEIIELLAMTATVSKCMHANPNTWVLPPSFMDDILNGMGVDVAINTYKDPWMPNSSDLRYIYIPICEAGSHWHLMVVAFFERGVYYLDTFKKFSEMNTRMLNLKFVKNFIRNVILNLEAANNCLNGWPDIADWQLLDAEGIPNIGHSKDSAIWLMDWLSMEDHFTSNLLGKIDEDTVRMRTMLHLIMAKCNSKGDKVKAFAGNEMRKHYPSTI